MNIEELKRLKLSMKAKEVPRHKESFKKVSVKEEEEIDCFGANAVMEWRKRQNNGGGNVTMTYKSKACIKPN